MHKYLRQGTLDFSVGYKIQTRWGPMEGVIFTLECAGAALSACAMIAGGQNWAMLIGVLLVASAIVLLLVHLGHPGRAWRAIRNVRTSWISRGTIVLGGFVGLGFLYLVLGWWGGMDEAATLLRAIRWMLLGACAFILVYPGLILSASPAIPFWNSGLLPFFSACNGAASGVALFMAIAGMAGRAGALSPSIPLLAFWILVLLALVVFVYASVMAHRGAAAAESVSYLMKGNTGLFIVGVCLIGLALPMLLMLWMAISGVVAETAMAAAVSRLAGDFAARHAFLKVGMFNPVV